MTNTEPANEKTKVGVWLDADTYTELKELADRDHRSVSNLLRLLVLEAIEKGAV